MWNDGSNSAGELERLGVPGTGVNGRMDKSSEKDSTGVSDVSTLSKVTGAPSICDRTQRQTKQIRAMEITPLGNE